VPNTTTSSPSITSAVDPDVSPDFIPPGIEFPGYGWVHDSAVLAVAGPNSAVGSDQAVEEERSPTRPRNQRVSGYPEEIRPVMSTEITMAPGGRQCPSAAVGSRLDGARHVVAAAIPATAGMAIASLRNLRRSRVERIAAKP